MRSTVQCAWTCYTMFNRILKCQFTFDLIDFSIFASTFKIDDDYNMKIYGKGHPLCAAVGFFETSCERRCQINKLLLETKKIIRKWSTGCRFFCCCSETFQIQNQILIMKPHCKLLDICWFQVLEKNHTNILLEFRRFLTIINILMEF